MTSHSKRLQLMQQRSGMRPLGPPSIMSGGGTESIVSGSLLSADKSGINQSQIDGGSYLKAPRYNPAAGPCSSIISGKNQMSKGGLSQLSINSQNIPLRPLGASKSLGGSKASMVSVQSHKSNIQQEYHDIKVKKKLNALSYGRASRPYRYFIICCVIGSILLLIGLILIYLRYFGELFLTLDKSELIGPMFIVAALLVLGLAIKFLVDSYRIGARERRRLGFRASGLNMVTVNNADKNNKKSHPGEYIMTGTTSAQALHKVPKVLHRNEIESSVLY